MTEHEMKNDKVCWLRPLIIGLSVIIALALVLGFGLNYGFKFYNASLQHKTEVLAQGTTTPTTTVETVIVEGTAAAVEKTTPETTTVTTTEQEAIETTVETTKESSVVKPGRIPEPYESEGGIPYNGSTWAADVAPDEIEVLSVGPGSSTGVDFKGGANPDIGGIFIFLGNGNQVTHYTVENLIAGNNWHGAYDFDRPITETDWKLLTEDRVKAMMQPPNGTSGNGCDIVQVAVIKGNEVIFQQTYEKQ